MRCQRELLVAAKLRRTDATRVAVKPEEAYDRTDAHTALLGSVRYGSPAMHRFDHAPTQVLRIRLRHPCWPPPSRELESYSRQHGNPRFSLFGKRSSLTESEGRRPYRSRIRYLARFKVSARRANMNPRIREKIEARFAGYVEG